MTENLNHTFSSDVICPFIYYVSGVCIRLIIVSLIEVVFFLGGGGVGLWSYVHHTVNVKVLCSDLIRPSGSPFIFSVHAIFDDLSKSPGDNFQK